MLRKKVKQPFEASSLKLLLVVVVIVVVYSSTNFSSVGLRKAAKYGFQFCMRMQLSALESWSPWKAKILMKQLEGGSRRTKRCALPMHDRWSGKSEGLAAGSQSPATKKRASLTGSCPPAFDDEHIELGGSHWANDKHWQPELFRRIHRDQSVVITAALSISIMCSCLYDLNSSLIFFTLCFQSTASFYSSISL